MEKTILRVLDGTVLTAELSSKLQELLPEFTVERYKEKPDHKRSFIRRRESLYAAFLFILEAYPLDPKFTRITKKAMTAYAENALRACDLSSGRFKDMQTELEQFTAGLVNALRAGWPWPDNSLTEAIACLNEAEQYVIMREGRPDIATLTSIDFGRGPEYFVQWDKSLPPYNEQWLAELKLIKAHAASTTPEWFRCLKEHEYEYCTHLEGGLAAASVTPKLLIADLQTFLDEIGTKKSDALNWSLELQKINEQKPPFSDWYNSLSKAKQEMLRTLSVPSRAATLESSIESFKVFLMEKNTNPLFASELRHSVTMPLWYSLLPLRQQLFLQHVLQHTDDLKTVVSFLSSRHRTLPVPANFGRHSILIINEKEIEALSPGRFRSSHISSRDVIPLPPPIQRRHCASNLEKIMEYMPEDAIGLVQTLITPIAIPAVVSAALPVSLPLPPDDALFHQARAAIERGKDPSRVFQHNHPFNYGKYFGYTDANNPDSVRLIAETEENIRIIDELQTKIARIKEGLPVLTSQFDAILDVEDNNKLLLGSQITALQAELATLDGRLPSFSARRDDLNNLLEEYRKALNSPFGSATIYDYNGRELFLSSLEQLIILNQDGFSYGSCVSGKDRKAIELMHTDAMLIYRKTYGYWPSFTHATGSAERIRFVGIVAKLYLSFHQHELAGQNAPGSEGIKTPYIYLPNDICAEITRQLGGVEALSLDDRLATNNEVKNIFSKGSLDKYLVEAHPFSVNLTLGEELCTQLYDSLVVLLNQKYLFRPIKSKFFFQDLPTGIADIKKLMKDPLAGDTNVERFARIMTIVNTRPPEGASRTDATNTVYNGIRGLLDPSLTADVLIQQGAELKAAWDGLYNRSKSELAKGKQSAGSSSDEESPCLARSVSSLL